MQTAEISQGHLNVLFISLTQKKNLNRLSTTIRNRNKEFRFYLNCFLILSTSTVYDNETRPDF